MSALVVGARVSAEYEYGSGVVSAVSSRSVSVTLDDGATLNLVAGSPGAERLSEALVDVTTVNTYADAFGVWHADVSFDSKRLWSCSNAASVARSAIRAELEVRENLDPNYIVEVQRTPLDVSDMTGDTVTFRYVEA